MRVFIIGLAVFAMMLPGSNDPYASSCCDQTFQVYGKTAGDNSMLFWSVTLGGECGGHFEGYALVLGDSTTPVLTFGHRSGDWVPRLFKDIREEKPVQVEQVNGRFVINDSVWIEPPPEDTTFVRKFISVINQGGGDPRSWYRMCPVDCSDYPVVHGRQSEVVYAYKGGVYKSYKFKEVIYYPESQYVVVITDQPQKAVGLDTMHGLLVIHLTHATEGE